MKYSEKLSNIAKALAEVQAEIKNPIKNQENKGVQGTPKYANLEDTLQEYVRPVLSKHKMSFIQSITSDDKNRVGVKTLLLHESGEFIETDYVFCEIRVPTRERDGKEILTQGQATGVCITYLRRYSLNAALGINGDKDTDGGFDDNTATNNYSSNKPTAAQKPLQTAINAPKTTTRNFTFNEASKMVLTFGKHNGKTISEIAQTDADYLNWVAGNERTKPELKEAINIFMQSQNTQPEPEPAPAPFEDEILPWD